MNTWKKYVLTEDESKKLVESDDQSFIGFSNLTSISVEVAHILALRLPPILDHGATNLR